MGINGLWPLLGRKGYHPQTVHLPRQHASTVRVDVQACFFPLLQRAFSDPDNVAYQMIDNGLLQVVDKATSVLYIDGHDTTEKARTHADRKEKREGALEVATKSIIKLEDLLAKGKPATKQLHISVQKI